NPSRQTAVDVSDPYLRVTRARGGVRDLFAVRGPGRGEICSAYGREVDHTAQEERVHANLEAVAAERGECEAAVVGCDPRRERDGAEMGDGTLVRPVVVHLPYLFVAATDLDVVDLGLRNALNAAA